MALQDRKRYPVRVFDAECLTDDQIADVAEGQRPLGDAGYEHLAACAECRALLAAVVRDSVAPAPRDGAPQSGEPAWDELGAGVAIGDGAYALERHLGGGAMGAVWGAARVHDGVKVAVKIARSVDPDLARRFEREARIIGALEHPNLARVLDVIPATRLRGPCIVQELVLGETVEQRLRREPVLSLRDAARILVPLGSALELAHARGVVHRDVKPANIVLGPERVVLVDFGIAKLLPAWGPHSKLTQTGAVLGTPRYMAPEQVLGDGEIDGRADVWAMGAIFYRMLTGTDLLAVDGVGAMLKRLRSFDFEEVRSGLSAELPSDVGRLVEAALRVARSERLATTTSFVSVLTPYAH